MISGYIIWYSRQKVCQDNWHCVTRKCSSGQGFRAFLSMPLRKLKFSERNSIGTSCQPATHRPQIILACCKAQIVRCTENEQRNVKCQSWILQTIISTPLISYLRLVYRNRIRAKCIHRLLCFLWNWKIAEDLSTWIYFKIWNRHKQGEEAGALAHSESAIPNQSWPYKRELREIIKTFKLRWELRKRELQGFLHHE